MLAHVITAAVRGVDSYLVRVEVNLAPGLPAFAVVGLAEGAVREGRERVGAALRNVGRPIPPRRITVNLAPADVRKDGSAFDLPVAVGLLAAGGHLDPERLEGTAFLGELGLDGSLRPVRGVLPCAARCAGSGVRALIVPAGNAREACVVGGLTVFGARSLAEVAAHLEGSGALAPVTVDVDALLSRPGGGRARPARREGPGRGQARPGDRRGRGAQRPHDRSARIGEDDAGAPPSGDPPPVDARGGARGHGGPLGRGVPPGRGGRGDGTAVSRAPSHGQRRGDGRGRDPDPPGGDLPGPPWRALPRRAGRVPAQRARGAPPTPRGRHRASRPGAGLRALPGAFPHGGGDEPLPVRLPRGRHGSLPVRSGDWWPAIGGASPGPCWTDSTCTSRCRRCPSSDWRTRRAASPRRWCGSGWPAHAPSRRGASAGRAACTRTDRWTRRSCAASCGSTGVPPRCSDARSTSRGSRPAPTTACSRSPARLPILRGRMRWSPRHALEAIQFRPLDRRDSP